VFYEAKEIQRVRETLHESTASLKDQT